MKPERALSLLALLLISPPTPAQAPEPAAPDLERLEAEFARRMSGSRLVGRFTDDSLPADAPLAEESYTLHSVEKLANGKWRIEAGIEYGERNFRVPIFLDVLWAGDTPILSLTDYKVPFLGTFSARVVIHGDRYAGIWDGADHGGQLFGDVIAAPAATAAPAAPAAAPAAQDAAPSVHWPSFRGRDASGVADGWATAVEWDVESGKNVVWKKALPGLAHSSPVIWGERIYLTTAIRKSGEPELKVGLYGDIGSVPDEGEHAFDVLCLDKSSGEVLWQRTAWEGEPAFKRHPKGSYAASTPATDGEHVLAFFGTEGLYCYDAEGELRWKNEFGPLDAGFYMVRDAEWGFGSSPVIHAGRVLVQVDVQENSFLGAFDVRTGEELWAVPRDDVPTWSTPTVHVGAGRSQVLCNGYKHAGGYDLETGEVLWYIKGGGDIPVPTPVVAHGLVYLTSAHGMMAPIYAVHLDAQGELTLDHEKMAWGSRRRGNYMQTPLVYGEEAYFCSDAGVLACYDARSGEEHYRERIGGGEYGFTASMVAADGKLYATGEAGEIHVVAAGSEFDELAVVEMGEECMATPAVSEGVIFWRTSGHLVAVGEE